MDTTIKAMRMKKKRMPGILSSILPKEEKANLFRRLSPASPVIAILSWALVWCGSWCSQTRGRTPELDVDRIEDQNLTHLSRQDRRSDYRVQGLSIDLGLGRIQKT